ncbi:MAG TPA: hypothetical protein VF766_04415 [Pyrinomonadaceae bacterium]
MKRRVLCMFEQLGKETLDLHELFEAGGNDMDARKEVFYTVERLVEEGLLEERGNDFYALTAEGKRAARAFTDELKDQD